MKIVLPIFIAAFIVLAVVIWFYMYRKRHERFHTLQEYMRARGYSQKSGAEVLLPNEYTTLKEPFGEMWPAGADVLFFKDGNLVFGQWTGATVKPLKSVPHHGSSFELRVAQKSRAEAHVGDRMSFPNVPKSAPSSCGCGGRK